jgi:hypothetical protein
MAYTGCSKKIYRKRRAGTMPPNENMAYEFWPQNILVTK